MRTSLWFLSTRPRFIRRRRRRWTSCPMLCRSAPSEPSYAPPVKAFEQIEISAAWMFALPRSLSLCSRVASALL